MSRGRKKPSLHTLSIEGPSSEEILQIADEVLKSSDRNAVILTSSNLEWQLGRLILSKLPNASPTKPGALLERGGPLSELFAKNHLGFALGLYNKDILRDLEVIRRIRNAFAHAPKPITFRNKLLAAECNKLKLQDIPEYKNIFAEPDPIPSRALRWKFVFACTDLTLLFLNYTEKLAKAESRRIEYKIKKRKKQIKGLTVPASHKP